MMDAWSVDIGITGQLPVGRERPEKGTELAGSLTPGADSTPEDTSTMYGRTLPTASDTFSGFNPPDRIVRRRAAIAAATLQSIVRPVPPRRTGIVRIEQYRHILRDGVA